MSVTIQIEPETGLAVATCYGVLTFDDAKEGAKSLWKTQEWAGKSAVWDFRKAQFDITSPEIKELAQFILKRQPDTPPIKMAFVAQNTLMFGLSRLFQGYRQDKSTDFRVFRDFDEALSWAKIV